MRQPVAGPVAGAMDLGDIVAGAWGMYTRRLGYWLVLAGVAFVATFALSLMSAAADVPENASSDELLNAAPLLIGGLLVVLLGDLLAQLAVIAAADTVLRGDAISPGAAYGIALKRFLPALAITAITAGAAGLLAGTIILVPLALFFFVRWSQALPILIVERDGVLGSLRRSKQIVSGQWWRTFGIGLAVVLLSFLPGFIFGAVFGAAGNELVSAFGTSLASLVATPFASIAHTLLYADLRARKGERPLPAPVRGTP